MEKKTIGKFISALRRANGMTQKELGERLFVSDKTVSRWERDECTPELSLIPAIAEIFGITADELLRGEKNSPDDDSDEQKAQRQKARSEKQFKLMLDSNKRKYDNYTLISVGIAIAGILAAVICNLGFLKGVLGFGLAFACFVASVICQTCFANNAKLSAEDENDEYVHKMRGHNAYVSVKSLKLYVLNGLLFAFCLPIGLFAQGIYGLEVFFWLFSGALFVLAAVLIGYIIYHLAVKERLIQNGVVSVTEKEKDVMAVRKKMLKRCLIVFTAIAVVLLIAVSVLLEIGYTPFLKRQTVDSPEEFAEFMQDEYDRWFHQGHDPIKNEMGEQEYLSLYESQKEYHSLQDSLTGKSYEFYYLESEYDMRDVDFDSQSGKVTFISRQARYAAGNLHSSIYAMLLIAMAASAVVCVTVYVVAVVKAKRK